jgi:hypothetical protein
MCVTEKQNRFLRDQSLSERSDEILLRIFKALQFVPQAAQLRFAIALNIPKAGRLVDLLSLILNLAKKAFSHEVVQRFSLPDGV